MVWVRIPSLNLVYHDESFLRALASAIGFPVKVDLHTSQIEHGRFARVCVEIDLNEPVVSKSWNQWRMVSSPIRKFMHTMSLL